MTTRTVLELLLAPAEDREAVARRIMETHGAQRLAAAAAEIVSMAESVTLSAVDFLELEAIITDKIHPHESGRWNVPTLLGTATGAVMADQVKAEGLCEGCALRRGTHANACLPTLGDLHACAGDGDGRPFLCHMSDPRQPCIGFARWRALVVAGRAEIPASLRDGAQA